MKPIRFIGALDIKYWNGMKLVRVSNIPKFGEWLRGQTCPLVEDDKDPMDWAYYEDYLRFEKGLRVLD